MTEAERIAAGLSEAQRVLWIRTILAMAGTAPQRNAFVDGYNAMLITRWASPTMREYHALGEQVRAILLKGTE
ncbi:hypothetical protein [Sphingobium sp. WCS2017Hpa-17]|uniref:hypothetical protein n=1 Tax=Sphingobium sp. WCS2017Hpa-17 TaxID=3073638 RepID=UPI00288A55FB|nr:hypothetical protein [Sphingobium sp. WCS2017Hpa-17]